MKVVTKQRCRRHIIAVIVENLLFGSYICCNGSQQQAFGCFAGVAVSVVLQSRNRTHRPFSSFQDRLSNNSESVHHYRRCRRSSTTMASSAFSDRDDDDAVTAVSTTTTSSTTTTNLIGGIRDIVDKYDCFLLDMWGVMHDGNQCYDGVLEAVRRLRHVANKELIIVSNSSKRRMNSQRMLSKLGFDPHNDFAQIITSGEVAHCLLRHLAGEDDDDDDDSSSWIPLNIPLPFQELASSKSCSRKVFCFGSGDGDAEYLTSCGWTLADDMDDADLIVARGPFVILTANGQIQRSDNDSNNNDDSYQLAMTEALQRAARRRVPMIVANPDKVRPDKDKSPMPGTIGVAYERALEHQQHQHQQAEEKVGDVKDLVLYLGKPFGDVYEIALRGRDRSRACMVGDALETDVTGANTAGIDSIWVIQDGIHNQEVFEKGCGSLKDGCHAVLNDFNTLDGTYAKGRQLRPTFIVPHFRW